MSLDTAIAALTLRPGLLAAAGCAGPDLARYTDPGVFGAVVTPTITFDPCPGAPWPRLAETPSGLIHALGTPGPGVRRFLDNDLPPLLRWQVPVIVSIRGTDAGEAAHLTQALRAAPEIAGIEVNVSDPADGTDATRAAGVVHQVRRHTSRGMPVFAKLGADVPDVAAVAAAVADAGADAVTLINAVPARGIDPDTRRPKLGGRGGLSGPAIRPLAVRAIWDVHAACPGLPIIGTGGVMSGRDALELILAGATAVAVGTALLADPDAGRRIAAELAALLTGTTLAAEIGRAHREEPE